MVLISPVSPGAVARPPKHSTMPHTAYTSRAPLCEDLLVAILDELPSRSLVRARNVCRGFAVLADEILRRRFLDIVQDESTQLILESCPPYEARSLHRQPIVFSHFGPSQDMPFTGNVAHFSVACADGVIADPQYLPLDDGELFAQNVLSVHLRSSPKPAPPDVARNPLDGFDRDNFVVYSSPSAPPRFLDYAYSLSLASSLDRLFRSWFLESASEAPPPPSIPTLPYSTYTSPYASRTSSPSPSSSGASTPTGGRHTRSKRLAAPYDPRSRSALFAAQIECLQVAREDAYDSDDDVLARSPASTSSSPGARFGTRANAPPRVYEYCFSSLELDVAKVVTMAEENLPHSAGAKRLAPGSPTGRTVPRDAPVLLVL
ncbi:F-box protein [Rhodotorula paludigena]|uniref:F-box protein n=1 Tax=Rhodotorula paludigena TaxID=86838 RepID=UPI00317FFC6C